MEQPDLPLDPDEAIELGREIGAYASKFAADHDRDSSFVTEGYAAIRELGYGALAVPRELGGGGHTLDTICRAQAAMAAGCANTSLAIAMHQHTVLTLTWRWSQGDSTIEPLLARVADGLLLCSSGTMDPRKPTVIGTPTPDGGLRVTGRKGVASGAPGCDVLGTPIGVDVDGRRFLSSGFVPLDAPGVTILDDWDAMGMRASGSNGVQLTDVDVPPDNVTGPQPWRRANAPRSRQRIASPVSVEAGPGEQFDDVHRMPGLLIAVTVIAAVYLGIADGVRQRALVDVKRGRHPDDPITYRLAGEMASHSQVAWWAYDGLLAAVTDDAIGTEQHFVATMLAKRQAVLGSIAVVETAMQMLGAMSYSRRAPYEQALRDVRAGITHPLAPDATLMAVGESVIRDQ